MLGKRDPIFWTASVIFAVALALGIIIDNGFFLLMVAAYLLRPTLHSLGFFPKLIDERQMQIQYRAGNVAFTAMVLGNIVLILSLMGQGNHLWESVLTVLLIGLAVRALAGLLMVGDPAVAGSRIIITVGLFFALFGIAEGGWSGAMAHVVPGLLVIAIGVGSRRYPRAIAIGLAVLTVAFTAVMAGPAVRQRGGPNSGTALVFAVVVVPLVTAAVLLWRGARSDDEHAPTVVSSGEETRR
jgi:hypothetical protein